MKKLFFVMALVGSLMTVMVSCKDDDLDLDALRAEELVLLEEYIEAGNIQTPPTESGLYYIETEAGIGDSIKVGDRVQIFYTGTLLRDSTKFDWTGSYEPYEFFVGSSDVISGMSEGLTHMKQGGKGTLIIPSNLAYGATNSSGIPRFSTLIFEIEVYKHFKQATNDEE